MEQTILNAAGKEYIFAVLFIFLLFYVLKKNEIREGKLEDIIKILSEDVQKEIGCLNTKVDGILNTVKNFIEKKV